MCGITGFFNTPDAGEHTLTALSILKDRGRDGAGACGIDWLEHSKDVEMLPIPSGVTSALGHTLHSMVNFVPQPIVQRGKLSANCEIYNWKQLNEKYGLDAANDSELLITLIEKRIVEEGVDTGKCIDIMKAIDMVLSELIGVYAFGYWLDGRVYIVRDIIGIKPLWYSMDSGFGFASEKKALVSTGYDDVHELEPRQMICYDIVEDVVSKLERDVFSIKPEHELPVEVMREQMTELLEDAVSIRIPDEPFGILFSGGLDSTIIAYLCKKLGKKPGVDFVCYTAGLEGVQQSPDVRYAIKVAESLGLELKLKEIDFATVEDYLKKVVPLIEDSNVPKVGVALTMYAACVAAKEDGMRVMFSGSGADELLAGYDRFRRADDINRACYVDIMDIYERNTYRDDVVAMNNNIELRVPYLDKRFVDYCLKIPAKYKIDNEQNKVILRMVGEALGIPKEFVQRKKQAAQYGSRFDKAIGKLAKSAGCSNKTEYLEGFLGVQK